MSLYFTGTVLMVLALRLRNTSFQAASNLSSCLASRWACEACCPPGKNYLAGHISRHFSRHRSEIRMICFTSLALDSYATIMAELPLVMLGNGKFDFSLITVLEFNENYA